MRRAPAAAQETPAKDALDHAVRWLLAAKLKPILIERADSGPTLTVYAAGQSLRRGVNVQRVGLAATLARLGYRETRSMPTAPGQYSRDPAAWNILPRDADDTGRRPRVRLEVRDERIVQVSWDLSLIHI